MRILLYFSIILVACQPAETVSTNPEVDAIFSEWDTAESPGCALAVVKDGEIIYSRGYGIADLEHNIPIEPSTVFYTGSVSKQFVTMAILLIEEQGKLNLDDDIRKHFTDFPDYGYPITIRNLIHHTSGIRDYLTLWGLAGRDYLDHINKYEVYEMIKRQKELNFVPGDRYLYSNSCYFMLSELVEMVTGETLSEFASKNILEPLGMTNSHFHDDYMHLIPNRAFSYFKNDNGYSNVIMRFDQVGSGGLYSTVEDLYLWDQNFYNNKLGKGTPQLIEKMHEEGVLNNGESAGYAFALVNGEYRGLRTVSHSGALAGYRSVITRFPDENFSVIILANIPSVNPPRRANEVAEAYLGDKMDPIVEDQSSGSSNGEAQSEEDYSAIDVNEGDFVGRYYSEELDVDYYISEREDGMYFSIGYQEPQYLYVSGNDTFTTHNNLGLTFQRSEAGEVTGFELEAGRVQHLKFVRVGE